jgi:hypothetical protein
MATSTVAYADPSCSPAPPVGCETWVARYDNPSGEANSHAGSAEGGLATVISPDSATVYVTGQSPADNGNPDFTTFAYDASSGTQRWMTRYDSQFHGVDIAYAIAVSPDGSRVYVTGSSADTGNSDPYTDPIAIATVAYDAATGTPLWASRYDPISGQGAGFSTSVAVSPDGHHVYVAGGSAQPSLAPDALVISYAAESGQQQWVTRESAGDGLASAFTAVRTSGDGSRLYVTGYSQANDGTGFLTFVTSSIDAGGGALLWTAKYESPNGDSDATALGLSPDGTRLFVTGESTGSGTSTDYLTLSYDAASGAQRWQAGYDGNADIDKATALAVAPDGSRVYVTGFSSGNATGTDYATLAYDAASGTQLWVTRYNGPADASDEAYAIALSPGGTVVYVTGHSTNVSTSTPKGASYATVAYDSRLGLQRWEARYNVHTPAPVSTTFSGDTAYAIAASPDGSRVIVTGISTSLTTTTDYDFATVAYDTSGTDSPATPVPEVPAVAAFAVIGLGVVALRRLRRWS